MQFELARPLGARGVRPWGACDKLDVAGKENTSGIIAT
jgi:hypothetical protein